MLQLIPRHIPPLSMMLGDMGEPSIHLIAIALGVSARTVRRWVDADEAPRPVMLALFWLTRWGQSAVNCKAHNDAVMYAGYVGCLKQENAALRADLARVLALSDTGAANVASWRALPLAQVLPFKAPERRPTAS